MHVPSDISHRPASHCIKHRLNLILKLCTCNILYDSFYDCATSIEIFLKLFRKSILYLLLFSLFHKMLRNHWILTDDTNYFIFHFKVPCILSLAICTSSYLICFKVDVVVPYGDISTKLEVEQNCNQNSSLRKPRRSPMFCDDGPTLNHHCDNVLCLLSSRLCDNINKQIGVLLQPT